MSRENLKEFQKKKITYSGGSGVFHSCLPKTLLIERTSRYLSIYIRISVVANCVPNKIKIRLYLFALANYNILWVNSNLSVGD